MSLDGVTQAPGGPTEDPSGGFTHGGWTVPFFDEALGEVMAKQMEKPFELLVGRITYEIFASYWPDHAEEWPAITQATKYVASNTLTKHQWQNSVFLKSDILVEEIKKLKQQPGPDIQVHGSSNVIQTLLKHNLVDELWLKTFPVVLGKGKRLFDKGTIPTAFTLTNSTTTPAGVIVANYQRAGELKTGSFGS